MRLASPEETEAFGCRIAPLLRAGDAITLYGDLGAGKTTLARGILRGLGFEGEVASPTYPIVQAYEELTPPLWHLDLYRIENPSELEELGLEEARPDVALLIEWPERLGAGLWSDALRLTLTREGEGRALTALVPTAWKSRWPPR
jgi:tRNA threonylcarbamoyladenosine biosynthesis protein TsaE